MRATETERRFERLLRSALWGLERDLDARELIPMLEHLLRCAPPHSEAALLAQRNLARLLLSRQPWRSAVLARSALLRAEDDQTWATLGIAQSLLGNFRAARAAYRRGLQLAPASVCCLHNLGHLLDIAFERPREALRYLRAAHLAEPDEPEIAASLAHALGRTGQLEQARRLLARALRSTEDEADRVLADWYAMGRATGEAVAASDAAAQPPSHTQGLPGRRSCPSVGP